MEITETALDKRFERIVFLSFIYSLAIFASAFFASYILCGAISDDMTFSLADPIYSGDTLSSVYSVVRVLIPAAIAVAVIFLSAFTPLGSVLQTLCLIWRGACLGACVSAIASRALIGTSKWTVCAVILYFLASVLIFILASLASVYRKMTSYAYAREEYSAVAGISVDIVKIFLVISGAIYTLSLISIILLQAR